MISYYGKNFKDERCMKVTIDKKNNENIDTSATNYN